MIVNFDEKSYLDKVNKFLDKIGSVEDGRASERIYLLMKKYGK